MDHWALPYVRMATASPSQVEALNQQLLNERMHEWKKENWVHSCISSTRNIAQHAAVSQWSTPLCAAAVGSHQDQFRISGRPMLCRGSNVRPQMCTPALWVLSPTPEAFVNRRMFKWVYGRKVHSGQWWLQHPPCKSEEMNTDQSWRDSTVSRTLIFFFLIFLRYLYWFISFGGHTQ